VSQIPFDTYASRVVEPKEIKESKKKVDLTVQKLLFEEWKGYKSKNFDEFALLEKCTSIYSDALLEISAIGVTQIRTLMKKSPLQTLILLIVMMTPVILTANNFFFLFST